MLGGTVFNELRAGHNRDRGNRKSQYERRDRRDGAGPPGAGHGERAARLPGLRLPGQQRDPLDHRPIAERQPRHPPGAVHDQRHADGRQGPPCAQGRRVLHAEPRCGRLLAGRHRRGRRLYVQRRLHRQLLRRLPARPAAPQRRGDQHARHVAARRRGQRVRLLRPGRLEGERRPHHLRRRPLRVPGQLRREEQPADQLRSRRPARWCCPTPASRSSCRPRRSPRCRRKRRRRPASVRAWSTPTPTTSARASASPGASRKPPSSAAAPACSTRRRRRRASAMRCRARRSATASATTSRSSRRASPPAR